MYPRERPATTLSHVLLLVALCITPYLGTLHHSWHLDDLPNIVDNSQLHIKALTPEIIQKTFFANPTAPGHLFRPVANFTFALNWLAGQDNPLGYHLVNICIHCLTAIMLYLTILALLQTPVANKRYYPRRASIALLAASLWAVAPIHTQSVTYIVQRMAQLAALFSISALFFYVRARLATRTINRVFFFVCCLVSAILALGSKENSILLPLSLLLIEYIFFLHGHFAFSIIKKNILPSVLLSSVLLLIGILVLYYYGQAIFQYEHRTFTLTERLMTEARILIFYLSQFFVPLAYRLSIDHDIIISTSLLSPWSTLPAIILCAILIIFGLSNSQKYPFLSFAILFYFLNHLVESTVLPLELIFEHRNYLPSLFLFLPIASFIVSMMYKGVEKYDWMKFFVMASCVSFLILSGSSTFIRNKAWATEKTLWQDAADKAPHNGRAMVNLAVAYADTKQFAVALELCDKAISLQSNTRNKIRPIALQVKGSIYFNQGKFQLAEKYYRKALALRNDYTEVADKIITTLIAQKRYQNALVEVTKQIRQRHQPELQLIKASLLLRLDKPLQSLSVYNQIRQALPTTELITVGQAKALSMLAHYDQADILYRWAFKHNEPNVILLRLENALRAGNISLYRDITSSLIHSAPLVTLLTTIEAKQTGSAQIPFNRLLVKKAILNTAEQITQSNRNLILSE